MSLFRRELRRTRPDLVVVVTTVLPAALLAARLEGLPTIAYVGEIFAKGYVEGRRGRSEEVSSPGSRRPSPTGSSAARARWPSSSAARAMP